MAFGHTDDVPNTFAPEAKPTPESSSLPPDVKMLDEKDLALIYIKTDGAATQSFFLLWPLQSDWHNYTDSAQIDYSGILC